MDVMEKTSNEKRLIDANKVVKNIVAERDKIPYELISEKPFKHGNSMRGGIRKALRCIEQAPTVDAVPVVRCRECIHRTENGNCGHPRHEDTLPTAYPNDFCSYGERKEGASNEP